MGDAPQRSFHAAQNNRHGALKMLPDEVRVNNRRAVRPAVIQAAGSVVVRAAGFAQRRGVCNQRVHRAGGDAPKKARLTQAGNIHRAPHVRLGDNPNAVAGAHQLLPNQRRAGIWAVYVGITADQDDVELRPVQPSEFFGGSWDEHVVIITDISSAERLCRGCGLPE